MPGLDVVGVDCHIGSQQTTIEPFTQAVDRLLLLVDALAERGIVLTHLNLGGGMGIRYGDERPPTAAAYASALGERIASRRLRILIEPGRAIVGNAGVLLTRVEYVKENGHRHFAVVDGAMNDLLRPALYQAWQRIVAVRASRPDEPERRYDVVGPVCESADFLGKDRALSLVQGDLLAVESAGAYGFVMSSNYNSRPRAAEVLVDGESMHLARPRERVEDLFAAESRLPATGEVTA
jgi:diaminopimelate decarboxylase